jgi:hypothetical protein
MLKDASRPETLMNINNREEAEEIRMKYPGFFAVV